MTGEKIKKESRKIKLRFSTAECGELLFSFFCGICPLFEGINPFGIAFLLSRKKLSIASAAGAVVALIFCPNRLIYALLTVSAMLKAYLFSDLSYSDGTDAFIKCAYAFVTSLLCEPFSSGTGAARFLICFVSFFAFSVLTDGRYSHAESNEKLSFLLFGLILCRGLAFLPVTGEFFATACAAFLSCAAVDFQKSPVFRFGFCSIAFGFANLPALGAAFALCAEGLSRVIPQKAQKLINFPLCFVLMLAFFGLSRGGDGFSVFAFGLFFGLGIYFFFDFYLKKKIKSYSFFSRIKPGENKNFRIKSEEDKKEDKNTKPEGGEGENSEYTAALSGCFSSLSRIFSQMSEREKKSFEEERALRASSSAKKFCRNCKKCKCDLNDLYCNLATAAVKNGRVGVEDLPEHIRFSCKNREKLLSKVNYALCAQSSEHGRCVAAFAGEYGRFAKLLSFAADLKEKESAADLSAQSLICEFLGRHGIIPDYVGVKGDRKKTVRIITPSASKIDLCAQTFSSAMTLITGRKMSFPEYAFNSPDGSTEIKFFTKPRFKVEFGCDRAAKDGEVSCGDSLKVFKDDDFLYIILSDGMGSGDEAGFVSETAVIYLEKLLRIGAGCENALKMLSEALSGLENEIFTTVDLLSVDLLTGKAQLWKAGAADSFYLRGEKMYKLDGAGMPTGILNGLKAKKFTFDIKPGDMIIMMTDGITHNAEFLPTLPPDIRSADKTAKYLLRQSAKGGICEDDMTVCTAKFI